MWNRTYLVGLRAGLLAVFAVGCGAAADDASMQPGGSESSYAAGAGPGGKADGEGALSFRFRAETPPEQAILDEAPGSFGSYCYLEVGKQYALSSMPSETLDAPAGTMLHVDLLEAPTTRQGATCSIKSGWVRQDRIELLSEPTAEPPVEPGTSTPPGDTSSGTPAVVDEFLSSFESWIYGRAYLLGGSCVGGAAGDCSSCPTTVLRNMGLGAVGTQADLDPNHFVACSAGDYRPGDLILMGYSCSSPDHWVALSTVNDPWNAVSTSNRIVDQSSDCAPHCGEGPMRSNLAKRKVCACARHKAFRTAWSNMP